VRGDADRACRGERRRPAHATAAGKLFAAPALLALFLAVGCDPHASTLKIDDVTFWHLPPAGRKVPAPRSVTTAPDGGFLVLDNSGRVLVYAADGTLRNSWPMPDSELGHPEGVCVLIDGRIAVADTHYGQIVVFSAAADGTVDRILGRRGTGDGEFTNPVGIDQGADGDLYICEYGERDRVQRLRVDGTFVCAFGQGGTGPGEFQRPSGLVWHDGLVYVADAVNHRLQVFTDTGTYRAQIGSARGTPAFYLPYDLAIADGCLYTIEYGASRLTKLTLDGSVLGRYGRPGARRDELETPWGMAVARDGTILVADTGNRRLAALTLAK
jgi:DNA-binding beta-propeller fold protein YncE